MLEDLGGISWNIAPVYNIEEAETEKSPVQEKNEKVELSEGTFD